MKKGFFIVVMITLVTFIAISLSSCGDDAKPSYNFHDQDVSGKIGNLAWEYADGYATIYGEDEDATLSISLFLAQTDQGCNVFIPEGDEVFFSLPLKTGLYKLKFNLSDMENSRTVTLFEDGTTTNHIASEGAVEITSISETQLSGKIDARVNKENSVNGKFSVSICN